MAQLTTGGRCLAVWLGVTAAATATVAWAAPDLRPPGPGAASFEGLLVRLAAVALSGCAGWAWVVTGIVLGQALAGRPRAEVRGVPRWLRTGVLLACGLAVAGAGGAARADDGTARTLDGLPYPDRVVGAVEREHRAPDHEDRGIHVVRPGDTLWDIAAADLPERAGAAAVGRHWRRVHARNRAVIGPDPDLIRPGQRLRMPTPHREEPR